MWRPAGLGIMILVMVLGCGGDAMYIANFPNHFPQPTIPPDNKLTRQRVELGKKMFFDKSLSLDSTIACVSCHHPDKAFTDGLALSRGIHGRKGKRNTPSIMNAALVPLINKDGGVKKLDLQALVPIEDENEMGISILHLSQRLARDPEYVNLSREAYEMPPSAYVITRALASFVRTLYSGNSRYDHFIQGDSTALTSREKMGRVLFQSDRLNCTSCHGGIQFTNHAFENNGLYSTYMDLGRALITLDSADTGKFRVPSLRNVGITAPYMHDGSLANLEEVINHYEDTGISPKKGQSKKIKAFSLSSEEKGRLIAFLSALTDEQFIN